MAECRSIVSPHTLAAYPLRLPSHSKLNCHQYPPLTSSCQYLPGGQTLPAPAAYPTIGPQPILGHVCLQLDRRAILSNIAFRPEKTSSIPLFFYRVPTAPRSRPFRVRLPSMRRTLIFSRVALPSKKLSLQ